MEKDELENNEEKRKIKENMKDTLNNTVNALLVVYR